MSPFWTGCLLFYKNVAPFFHVAPIFSTCPSFSFNSSTLYPSITMLYLTRTCWINVQTACHSSIVFSGAGKTTTSLSRPLCSHFCPLGLILTSNWSLVITCPWEINFPHWFDKPECMLQLAYKHNDILIFQCVISVTLLRATSDMDRRVYMAYSAAVKYDVSTNTDAPLYSSNKLKSPNALLTKLKLLTSEENLLLLINFVFPMFSEW